MIDDRYQPDDADDDALNDADLGGRYSPGRSGGDRHRSSHHDEERPPRGHHRSSSSGRHKAGDQDLEDGEIAGADGDDDGGAAAAAPLNGASHRRSSSEGGGRARSRDGEPAALMASPGGSRSRREPHAAARSSRERSRERDRRPPPRDRSRDRQQQQQQQYAGGSSRQGDVSRYGGSSGRYGSEGDRRGGDGPGGRYPQPPQQQRGGGGGREADAHHRDSRKRRSRSREQLRERGGGGGNGGYRERGPGGGGSGRYYDYYRGSKRSRDDGDDEQRRRRRSPEQQRQDRRRSRSEDDEEEPELDLDPAALLQADALGLSREEAEAAEEQRRLEESRRRRQAILAKHQQAAAVAAPTATAAAAAGVAAGGGEGGAAAAEPAQPPAAAPAAAAAAAGRDAAAGGGDAAADGAATPSGERSSSEDSNNAPGSPVMEIWNPGQEASSRGGPDSTQQQQDQELTSQLPAHLVLPGTEPNMQSERLRVGAPGGDAAAAAAGGGGDGAAAAAADAAAAAGDDMFAEADDDDDDMFAADDGAAGAAGGRRKKGLVVPAGLQDNYDDAEGYYNFQVGEVLDNRYEVFACKGKGVFSTVLRARDKLRLVTHPVTGVEELAEVAIKIIRSNETMAKAAALEQRILRLLGERDPEGRKHVVRLLRVFEFRGHVALVFEPMDMNLRELTLKYGRNVGLNISAVAVYTGQLLVALRHLQQAGVLHADIKPDNILVNARRSKVKICDLGSAMLAGQNDLTPYLVSRFYRAPEVILGLPYDHAMDVWSLGCVLYELFTGRILFPGRSNNEMLKLMMDVKGPFPKKMLKKGIFVDKHYDRNDQQLSFSLIEEDPVTRQPVRRVIPNPAIKHNFSQLLARAEGDKAQVSALIDLLEGMLALDPDKRITPDAALRHPFVKPHLPKKKPGGAAAAATQQAG